MLAAMLLQANNNKSHSNVRTRFEDELGCFGLGFESPPKVPSSRLLSSSSRRTTVGPVGL